VKENMICNRKRKACILVRYVLIASRYASNAGIIWVRQIFIMVFDAGGVVCKNWVEHGEI